MGRTAKEKCTHNDCFTCPYEDCIDTSYSDSVTTDKRKGPGRPKLPPDVVAQHQKEWRMKNYQKNREKLLAKSRKYYNENKEKVQAKQKEYRERRKNGL